jgi:hypothetical protein
MGLLLLFGIERDLACKARTVSFEEPAYSRGRQGEEYSVGLEDGEDASPVQPCNSSARSLRGGYLTAILGLKVDWSLEWGTGR